VLVPQKWHGDAGDAFGTHGVFTRPRALGSAGGSSFQFPELVEMVVVVDEVDIDRSFSRLMIMF
jgi:hypothetical protein